jgi:hypothetical protein
VARRPKNAPEPTSLHLDFIRASEEEAEARSNAQRKQLEEMAAAQAQREAALHKAEEALKQAAEAQRKRARVRNIAFEVVSIFFILLVSALVARQELQQRLDIRDAEAMTNLGLFYQHGNGVAPDYAKAREWYEKAAAKGDASAKANLEKLSIMQAARAGRYAEALQLQEAQAANREEVETEREGKPGKETAEALYNVAWYALFAREFTKALTAADRVHALLPHDPKFHINRAHALMFVGRGEDSKTLYLANKGKPISGPDGPLWEHVIVEDFAEFRKAGLMHPMMADIERELGASPLIGNRMTAGFVVAASFALASHRVESHES